MQMEIGTIVIYSITNKENGRTYVGQAVDWDRRQQQHLSSMNGQRHWVDEIQNDFNTYGKATFNINVEYYYDGKYNDENDLLYQLDRLETYYIKKLNAFEDDGGYNSTTGGRKHFKFSQNVIRRMSDINKEKFNDPEFVEMFSQTRKEVAARPEFREHLKNIGGQFTEEGKQALIEKSTERMNRPEVKEEWSKRMTERYKDPNERKKTSEATKAGMAKLPTEKLSREHLSKVPPEILLEIIRDINDPNTKTTQKGLVEKYKHYECDEFKINIALMKKLKSGKHIIYKKIAQGVYKL